MILMLMRASTVEVWGVGCAVGSFSVSGLKQLNSRFGGHVILYSNYFRLIRGYYSYPCRLLH